MAARTSEDGRDDGTGDPLAAGRAGRDHAGEDAAQLSAPARPGIPGGSGPWILRPRPR